MRVIEVVIDVRKLPRLVTDCANTHVGLQVVCRPDGDLGMVSKQTAVCARRRLTMRQGRELQLNHRSEWIRKVQHPGLHLFRSRHHEHVDSASAKSPGTTPTDPPRRMDDADTLHRTSSTSAAKPESPKRVSPLYSTTETRRSRPLASKNMRQSASPGRLSWEELPST
jgi:hypothetical protein